MSSSSHCDLCGTEIVQGSCQNPDCENCSCYFGNDDEPVQPKKKLHTYTFQAKNLATKEVINATVEANGKTNAQNAALMDTRFKAPWSIVMSSFRRTDTAKGANRAGGLDSNGKQRNARTVRQTVESLAYRDFLHYLNLAIDNLYACHMENNGAVLSMPIKQLYEEMKDFDPFAK